MACRYGLSLWLSLWHVIMACLKQLWREISSPSVVGKSQPEFLVKGPAIDLLMVGKVMTESVRTTFDSQWEVMPAGREKVVHVQRDYDILSVIITSHNLRYTELKYLAVRKAIHVQGVHCEFELSVSDDSVFTGIFAPGKVAAAITTY